MLFSPLDIRGVRLKNRVVVAPRHQHSAVEGFATDWHLVDAGKYAQASAPSQPSKASLPHGKPGSAITARRIFENCEKPQPRAPIRNIAAIFITVSRYHRGVMFRTAYGIFAIHSRQLSSERVPALRWVTGQTAM
jgi:hypothetical protein